MKSRILTTAALLAIYQLGLVLPVPGVDRDAWSRFVLNWDPAWLEVLNLLTGRGFQSMSICALGLVPLIIGAAAAAMTRFRTKKPLAAPQLPTTFGAFVLPAGLLGGFLCALLLEYVHDTNPGMALVAEPGWTFRIVTAAVVGTGSLLVAGIVALISARGTGIGVSVVITANVLAAFPALLGQVRDRPDSALALTLVGFAVVVLTIAVVHIDGAERRLSIRFEERVVGDETYGGASSALPLKLVFNGHKPVVYALVSTVFLSVIVALFTPVTLGAGTIGFVLVFAATTMLLNTLMTALDTDPRKIASDLVEAGARFEETSAGTARDDATAEESIANVIDHTLLRLSIISTLFVSAIAVLPHVIMSRNDIASVVGGVSLIVAVVTVLRLRARLSEASFAA